MSAVQITKENFETEVINSKIPVLVDFWASWCGPCKMVAPIIDSLAEDFAGKVKVVKVNVDDEGELALRYNVMSIPTIIIFKNGEIAETLVGANTKNYYAEILNNLL